MNTAPTIPEAQEYLRQASRRGRYLAPELRRVALKCSLAYLMQKLSTQQQADLMTGLAHASQLTEVLDAHPGKVEPPSAQTSPDAVSAPSHDAAHAVLNQLLHSYFGRDLPQQSSAELFKQMLAELNQQIHRVCQVPLGEGIPWQVQFNRAAAGLNHIEAAMRQAANESFERLLSALNPAGAKQQTERKKWSFTASYKAELYDAIAVKYTQLRAYHDKGRMVRDFRSLYKMHYKRGLK